VEFTLVVNPRAGAGRAQRWLPRLEDALRSRGARYVMHLTRAPGHATELVRRALGDGTPGVAVVGGDGTLNEAVNGFFDDEGNPVRDDGPWLGPLPCGTGGDFRKTIGAPKEPSAAAARLLRADPRPIDVGWLEFVQHDGSPGTRAFLNIASFGVGGEVDRIVNESPKWLGGRAAFFVGTLRALARYRNRRVRVRLDGGEPRETSVLNMAIANGQYFGGGMHIAPRAKVDDGVFDVVGIETDALLRQLRLTRHLYGDDVLTQEGVTFARAREILAEPIDATPVTLDVDGEAPGRLPARFELRQGVLRLR